MTDDPAIDAKLAALLSELPSPPDEAFIARVDRSVAAEQKIVAAQAALWRRFAREAAGSVAVVGAFYILWRASPADISPSDPTLMPVMSAGMVLLLWLGTAFSPASVGKYKPEGL